jgi:hypothetical protein
MGELLPNRLDRPVTPARTQCRCKSDSATGGMRQGDADCVAGDADRFGFPSIP